MGSPIHNPMPIDVDRPMSHDAQRPMTRRMILVAGLAALCVGSSSGCQNLVNRGQSYDEKLLIGTETDDPNTTKYIARVCKMSGLDYLKIEGVAVVSNLPGTGSSARPGKLRDRLLRDLETIDLPLSAERFLESTNTEMVLVKGLLPPGTREGDNFDLEIFSLTGTDATSLDGGYLQKTRLRTTAKMGGTVKDGHLEGLGRGSILTRATFETRDDASNRLSGTVLGGGVAKSDRDLALLIRNGSGSIKTSTSISGAINQRFTVSTSSGLTGVANSKTDQIIQLKIPHVYRFNVGRYAQVISNMTYSEPAHMRVNRMDELELQLQDPLTTGLAAVRLEAIGKQALPTLKRALRHPDPNVRFSAAQSLAYFDMADGVDELKAIAQTEPSFRWQAITALTTIDSARSDAALESLLVEDSAETRYGALRALRLKNPDNPLVAGKKLLNEFRLVIVDNEGPAMLHFAKHEIAEITLFNDAQTFNDKFLFVETGLTVKSNGDGTVSIATYSASNPFRATCSDRVSDVIQTMTEAGFGYSTLLKMSRKAMQEEALNSRLVVDATPKIKRHYQGSTLEQAATNSAAGKESTVASKIADRTNTIKDSAVKPAGWFSNVKERFSR